MHWKSPTAQLKVHSGGFACFSPFTTNCIHTLLLTIFQAHRLQMDVLLLLQSLFRISLSVENELTTTLHLLYHHDLPTCFFVLFLVKASFSSFGTATVIELLLLAHTWIV